MIRKNDIVQFNAKSKNFEGVIGVVTGKENGLYLITTPLPYKDAMYIKTTYDKITKVGHVFLEVTDDRYNKFELVGD